MKPVPETLLKLAEAKPRKPKAAYVSVCGSQYFRPSIGQATLKILKSLDLDFMITENICCGLPAASYGVMDSVKDMAKQNIKKFESGGFDLIIGDDSSCLAHFKEYPKILEADPEWRKRAQAFSLKVRDLSSYLVQVKFSGKCAGQKWNRGPVAYHDPCKAQYSQKQTEAPRALLRAVQGLEVIPVPDADQCCGGGRGRIVWSIRRCPRPFWRTRSGTLPERGAKP